MSEPTTTTPLVKAPSHVRGTDESNSTLSPFTRGAIGVLGYLRVLVGASILIAPITLGRIYHVPLTQQTAIVGRIAGVRDIAVGELLLLADKQEPSRRELRRVLWANVAVDTVDVLACGYGLAVGAVTRTAAVGMGGGALLAIGLGVAGLRGL